MWNRMTPELKRKGMKIVSTKQISKVVFDGQTLIDLTQDTVTSDSLLSGKKAHNAKGEEIVGSMYNRGGIDGRIYNADTPYLIPEGFHDGTGTVDIAQVEKDKIIPDNIREGVTILGVEGTMTGMDQIQIEAITVTPSSKTQTITPSEGYDYISQITVNPIPYNETENTAGGITVAIG